MTLKSTVLIHSCVEKVWSVVTNIENAAQQISGIEKVEILHKPESGLLGLKWRETRTMFGQTATEEMWVTDVKEHLSYDTQAQSHGSLYLSTLSLEQKDQEVELSMSFTAKPQSFVAKLLYYTMGFLFKSATQKALLQDLKDIKNFIETPNSEFKA
ncbi:MAG: SRPBCC family protein [Thiovulaceae bacterium]|nr:SRPBCC family protein [Sulfurimonadaceae bacterium]